MGGGGMPDGTRQRPAGIRIIAILAAIGSVFGIVGGWALITGASVLQGTSPLAGFDGQTYGGLASTFGRVVVVVALAQLAFAYGAWTFRRWAWTVGAAVAVIDIILTFVNVATGGRTDVGTLVALAIPAIILYYLSTRSVKAAFGRRS
jgi:hypothetical protein